MAARNSQCERPLEGEEVVRDIFSRDDTELVHMTVAEFLEEWKTLLSRYSDKKIIAALDKMGAKQERIRINGKLGRYRELPRRKRV